MNNSEFDQYASDYDKLLKDSLPKGLSEDSYFAEYKIALIARILEKNNLPATILDFGCGSGRSLPHIARYFPQSDISGFDISSESIKIAAASNQNINFFSKLDDIPSQRFDLILAANVFHHIPIGSQAKCVQKCYDALKAGGSLFIFEHNPLNPVTRRVFERCPFDVDAEMIFPKTIINLGKSVGFNMHQKSYTLFFPKPLSALRKFEWLFSRLPFGAQYYVRFQK